MWKFDLSPLDLVENKIPVLHSLSPEWWQNFTWNSIILSRNIFVQKSQKKVILAITLLISRTQLVLKASLASMTSRDMITSLASMTSTASMTSVASMTSAASLTSTASMTSVASMTSTASFHIKNFQHDVAINLATKWPILDSLCGMDHQKYSILLISGTLSVGGCGGHGCYFQPNLRVISQISASQKCTDYVFMT